MSNPRALDDGGSGPLGITGGRPPLDLEGLNGDGKGGAGGRGLTSWLGRFSQGHVTRPRRGSVGFEASVGTAPLLGMDEDSNSKDCLTSATLDITSNGQGDLVKQSIPFGRKRDLSFSDIQTPGGDGDTFLLNYKRKPSIDYADSPPKNMLTLQNGNISFELDKTSPKDSSSVNMMKTIHEGKKTNFNSNPDDASEELQRMGLGGFKVHDNDNNSETEKNSSSIFLIDLETEQDGQNIKLVPKTKKFAVSSLMNKEWAQNWFFRNDDNAVDNDSPTATAHESKSGDDQDVNGKKSKDGNLPESTKKPSFIGKIKKLVEENPGGYREMNTWQPQGQ